MNVLPTNQISNLNRHLQWITITATSVSEWILNTTIKSRWDRISNNNQWLSIADWNKQVLWPLKFIITNHPINNQIIFQLYHNTTQTYATGYVFENNIFTPNKLSW